MTNTQCIKVLSKVYALYLHLLHTNVNHTVPLSHLAELSIMLLNLDHWLHQHDFWLTLGVKWNHITYFSPVSMQDYILLSGKYLLLLEAHCEIWQLIAVLQLRNFSFVRSRYFAWYYFCWFLCILSSIMAKHLKWTSQEADREKSGESGVVHGGQQLETRAAAVRFAWALQRHWRSELLSPPSQRNFLKKSPFQIVLPVTAAKERKLKVST